MSKEHARNLFARHLEDLKSVCPNAGEVFVCPICFEVFSRDDLDDDLEAKKLDTGHVWPRLMRQSSETARHQQVLLCTKCNTKAGGHGDAMMQEFEQVRREEETGKLSRRRIMIGDPGRLWVNYEADVERTGDDSLLLRNRILRDDPKKLGEMKKLDGKRGRSIMVFPHRIFDWLHNKDYRLTWRLIRVGWLTSAYLLAFDRLGYRYILQSYLDPVREYIRTSFEKKVDDRLDFAEHRDTCVLVESGESFEEPLFSLFVSTREGTPDHLEISFLDYRIRLPFRHSFQCEVVEGIPYWKIDTSNRLVTLPLWCEPMTEYPQVPPSDSEKSGFCIVAPFRWDMIVDEPDYCVVGSSLVRKDE